MPLNIADIKVKIITIMVVHNTCAIINGTLLLSSKLFIKSKTLLINFIILVLNLSPPPCCKSAIVCFVDFRIGEL